MTAAAGAVGRLVGVLGSMDSLGGGLPPGPIWGNMHIGDASAMSRMPRGKLQLGQILLVAAASARLGAAAGIGAAAGCKCLWLEAFVNQVQFENALQQWRPCVFGYGWDSTLKRERETKTETLQHPEPRENGENRILH
jgi:hypothetical protein